MTVTGPRTAASTTTTGLDTRTRRLLGASIVSVALFGTVSLTQVATRAGFDLTRHPLSMLSNGDLGWLQITNLIVTGLLTVLGAIGLRQALRGTPGGTWAPRLLAVNGVGLVLAGPFVLQGGDGFPVDGPAVEGITTGTIGHILAASIAFFALIGACYVLGRHYARTGRRAMAIVSRSAGTFFLAADTYSMAGGPAGSLVLAIGVLTAMMWVAIVAHVERARS